MTFNRDPQRENGESQPRSGTPRKIDPRTERLIIRTVKNDPEIIHSQLKTKLNLNVSRATINRTLQLYNLKKWLKAKRPELTEEYTRIRF
jgi:response regulator of citrate/malate metabolism